MAELTKSEHRRQRASRFMRHTMSNTGRQMSTRFSRFSRISRVSAVKADDFRLRKSLADIVRDELDAQNRALFHQRICIVAKNRLPSPIVLPEVVPDAVSVVGNESQEWLLQTQTLHALPSIEITPERRFRENLAEKLTTIHRKCIQDSFTIDQLNGLSLCMGEYTVILLEGADDMVGEFCLEVSVLADQLWSNNKILSVEDRIGDMYFKSLLFRFCSPINSNEKFPTATPNDEYLMGQEHWTILKRVQTLCTTLAADEKAVEEPRILSPLAAERYNKLVPEVQRLDLVLSSTRFYRSVQQFASVYWRVPQDQDEDALTWPVPFGYAPLGVFERSPFDVNLTFADYGNEMAANEELERGSEASGENHAAGLKEAF